MHDRAKLTSVVVVEPEREAETVAQRRRQEARARRRTDERERRQVEGERPRARTLAHDDVDAEVLERRIENLLRGAAHTVDLVDEEHVARLERGEDRRNVLLLDGGAGDRAEADAELLADDVRERRLAEPRRAREQHMVERLAPRLGGDERNLELLLHALLPDELVERARAQRLLDRCLVVLVVEHRRDERAHAAFRRACRTRSSGVADESVCESARSASVSE
jgi:hypothetical protein